MKREEEMKNPGGASYCQHDVEQIGM